MILKRYRIHRFFQETKDSFTFILKPVEKDLLSFLPGQFNMLYLFGFGEIPISISGDPAKTDEMAHTIRVVGSVTKAMGLMKEADEIGVRGPFGNSWPISKKGIDLLIVAGGVGIAPLRPLLYSLIACRSEYKKITLLYGARTPEDLLYKNEIEEWKKQGIDVIISVDRGNTEWRGNVGVITTFIHKNLPNPEKTRIFLCGPEIMMKFALLEIFRFPVPSHEVYLSMERNMKCATGFCGHCLYGPYFLCKDGPIFSCDQIKKWLSIKEL